MLNVLHRLRNDEKGATAIEYGLIAALLVMAIMGSLTLVGGKTSKMWLHIDTEVTEVMTGGDDK